jgi:hypothetical protein
MKAIVLNCPQCGAHLDSSRSLCEHCGTTVRLSDDKQHLIGTGISCPSCNTNNQFGDRHCGSCGEKLIVACPVPNCLEENNVWRKFCKKCGKEIIGFRVEMLEAAQAKYKEEMEKHLGEIERVLKELPKSKGRETSVKIFTWITGVIIALAFLLSGGKGWIGTILTLLIAWIISSNYHSTENYNLLCSLELHEEDVERLKQHYEANQAELAKIRLSPNKG